MKYNVIFDAREQAPFIKSKTALFCVMIVSALLLKALYNIYFHRLSAFKGPKLFAASDIPLAILQLRGIAQYPLRKAHEKYGDVVRIGPNTLSFIAPSAWNDIYGYQNGIAVLPKDPQFYNEMMLPKETITLASDRDAVTIRRAMNTAFSHKALLEQEPMLQSHIQRLMLQIAKNSHEDGAIDLRKWFTFSIFDINSDFAFGEDMGCVAAGAFHEWVQFVVDFFYAATLLHQCHKFAPLNRLLALCIPRSVRERQRRHHETSLQRVHRRMNTNVERPDFMHHFVRHARKEGLSEPTIEAQASVVILAGSETTSVALTAAVYFILSNPHVYETLCKEIRRAFADYGDIRLRDVLSKLPYLEAVVQETLRLHAPLANGFTRVVPDAKGAMISGHCVPKGTVVFINHYCSNTSSQNFQSPFSFIPDRWLGNSQYASDKRDVVQPFSVGPRNCPGRMFALNNVKLMLTHLLWTFNMKLGEGTVDWEKGQKIFNGWVQPALPVVLERRV